MTKGRNPRQSIELFILGHRGFTARGERHTRDITVHVAVWLLVDLRRCTPEPEGRGEWRCTKEQKIQVEKVQRIVVCEAEREGCLGWVALQKAHGSEGQARGGAAHKGQRDRPE